MAYCIECGARLNDGQNKCPACGKVNRTKRARDDSWDIYKDNGRKGGYEYRSTHREEPREEKAQDYYYESTGEKPFDAEIVFDSVSLEDKIFAALSYVSWLFLIPLLLKRHDEFVRFHLNQGLVLFLFGFFSTLIGIVGGLITIAAAVLCVMGFVHAITGTAKPLPVIGQLKILK